MSTMTIIIQCDNAAFQEDPHAELDQVLKEISQKAREESDRFNVLDINGNTVASVLMEE